MTDTIKDAAAKLRKELNRLEAEAEKTRKALAALEALASPRHTGQRVRRSIYPVKCATCGAAFEVYRDPQGKPSYCHNPCQSRGKRGTPAAAPAKAKSVTLVKGDALTAGH